MKFKRFPSIENHYQEKYIDYVRTEIIPNMGDEKRFIATEKVHGANFSFWVDSTSTVKAAKRSSFIKDDFYGYEEVFERYKSAARNVNKIIVDDDSVTQQLLLSISLMTSYLNKLLTLLPTQNQKNYQFLFTVNFTVKVSKKKLIMAIKIL